MGQQPHGGMVFFRRTKAVEHCGKMFYTIYLDFGVPARRKLPSILP